MRLSVRGARGVWSERQESARRVKVVGDDGAARQASRAEIGAWGEGQASAYLEGLGWQILSRNWRRRSGELDLVAVDGDRLVFVEVRTLGEGGVIRPEETVVWSKRRQVARQARWWLCAHEEHARGRVWCFDVVGVRWPSGALTHIRGAFEGWPSD